MVLMKSGRSVAFRPLFKIMDRAIHPEALLSIRMGSLSGPNRQKWPFLFVFWAAVVTAEQLPHKIRVK